MIEPSAWAAELSLQVPRGIDGPAFARRVVQTSCAAELPAQQLADLLVIVSELTTNALLHGVGEITLRVSVENGRASGEVSDQGSGFARDVRDHGIDDVGKRGLLIVGTLADRWGIHERASHVWFELGSRDESHRTRRDGAHGAATLPEEAIARAR
jgi:anti-sigma regulatory factor (Ser/Thr protein kinase)